ncbi:MAG TPA: ribonuclease III [Sphingopyxis sp.]|nr:ribonuclease III [Sphingopyxis sp.]
MIPELTADILAQITGAKPQRLELYREALTHGSSGVGDYQRLEFLGDRVLGLVLASELFRRYPTASEGELSSRLHALASGETCAQIAHQLNLSALVHFGTQAIGDGGRHSDNIAGDVVEAIIGALWLDLGDQAARDFIVRLWGDMMAGQVAAPKHPKAALQEWAAARKRRPPEYRIIARDGPDHAPHFRIGVSIGKLAEAEGQGTSKQAAEKAAAAALLARLTEEEKS